MILGTPAGFAASSWTEEVPAPWYTTLIQHSATATSLSPALDPSHSHQMQPATMTVMNYFGVCGNGYFGNFRDFNACLFQQASWECLIQGWLLLV
jgi:hypothetical protein